MKIIVEKVKDNKLAQLVLCSDNLTVNVIYDGICIDSSSGGTWDNIKSDFIEIYLDMIVSSYLDNKKSEDLFNKKLEGFGWD